MLINLIIFLIFIVSIIYTFKYKFVQLNIFDGIKPTLNNKSSILAFFVSLGSHIGAGNILGVTAALIVGGPGSLFWMIICTFFTTIFSLMENTIGMKYRVKIDNEYRGGSPYYILFGLNNLKLSKIFSYVLVLSSTIFFLPIQVKGVEDAIIYNFDVKKIYILLCLIVFSFFVIFKGTKRLTTFLKYLVPIMTIIFLITCFYALFAKYYVIGNVIKIILNDALRIRSGLGGIIAVGLKRSLFSNEAGLGTAPSINAMSDTDKPLSQGYLQVLTCFIDTIVMCVLLGFIILQYNVDLNSIDETKVAILVFEQIFNNYGNHIGSFFLFTFSLATIVSGYYAGETNMLFNGMLKGKRKRIYKLIYKILFISGLIIGTFFSNNNIWNLVDIGLILLGVINIVVIIKLESVFKKML